MAGNSVNTAVNTGTITGGGEGGGENGASDSASEVRVTGTITHDRTPWPFRWIAKIAKGLKVSFIAGSGVATGGAAVDYALDGKFEFTRAVLEDLSGADAAGGLPAPAPGGLRSTEYQLGTLLCPATTKLDRETFLAIDAACPIRHATRSETDAWASVREIGPEKFTPMEENPDWWALETIELYILDRTQVMAFAEEGDAGAACASLVRAEILPAFERCVKATEIIGLAEVRSRRMPGAQ